MAKNTFAQEVQDIKAPVQPDGSLLIGAAQSNAKALEEGSRAQVIAAQATANALKSAVGLGMTAGQEYLKSKEEDDINSVLKNLDVNVDNDINANNKKLAGQFLDSYQSEDFAGSSTVASFNEEARKYADARAQGVIGRDEAVAQIGAIVKKYSAMVPGFASEFRKVGANLTGISNIDVYGIHQALTTQSAKEKQAAKVAEANLQLAKEAAQAGGFTNVADMPADYLAFYKQTKQLAMHTQAAENQRKQVDIAQGNLDDFNGRLASTYIAQGVAGMATEFAKLHAANLTSDTPIKQEEAQRLGGELSAKIDVLESQLVSRINNLTVGRNAMSREAADKVINNMRPQLQAWKDAVKNADGFNLWSRTLKNAKGNVDHIVNTTLLAAPHLANLKELGVLPAMAQAYLATSPALFRKNFGDKAADAMEVVMKGPQAYADAFRLVATGQSSIADEVKRNPTLGKVLYNDAVKKLDDYTKKGSVLSDQEKLPFAQFVGNYADNVKVGLPNELKQFQKIMLDPNMRTLIDQLPPELKSAALTPVIAKIDRTVPENVTAVRSAVDAYNALDTNRYAGNTIAVVRDPVTGQLKVDVKQGNAANRSALPKGAIGADMARMATIVGPRIDSHQRAQIAEIQRDLDWLNTVPHLLTRTVGAINQKFDSLDPGAISQQIKDGIDSGNMSPLVNQVLKDSLKEQMGVPKNQPTDQPQLDDQRIQQAIIAAERSDTNAGLSPAGALGPMQLMPETAKELGLQVDPTKGIDERTDINKAGPAAVKYIRQHLSQFDGDVEKAAAAYNAGASNVKAAIAKAAQAGTPEDWVFFLPKPSETGPYIKRFLKAIASK